MNQLLRHSIVQCAAVIACSTSTAEPAMYRDLLRLCEGISSSMLCYQTIEAAQSETNNASRFSRHGSVLVVRSRAGTTRFKDQDLEGPKAIAYTYLSFLPGLRLHVVHAQLWEGSEYVVVAERTLERRSVPGFPLVSPDNERAVATSAAGESGYYTNTVQVWRIAAGLVPELSYSPKSEDWEPGDARWLNSSTIRVDGVCKPRSETARPCPKLFKRQGRRWQVSDDA